KRNKVKVIKNTEETNHIVNKIKAINLLHEDKQNEFKKITLPKDSIVITGDGFYIVLHNYEIIDSCYLKGDERTKIEYEYYIEYLKELIKNRHSNINKIINETCEQINKKLTKKLNY
ncbi:MAG: hypothetical protein IJZ36_05115, partial [Bacilli bacterium]|nr:hypothetical protein [Bacilli bacterium]